MSESEGSWRGTSLKSNSAFFYAGNVSAAFDDGWPQKIVLLH
jgi:hypothetical protein